MFGKGRLVNKSVSTKKRRMPAQAFVAETSVKASENHHDPDPFLPRTRGANAYMKRMRDDEQGQGLNEKGMARKFVAPLEGR